MAEVGDETILLKDHGQKSPVKEPPFDLPAPVIFENRIRKVSFVVKYTYPAPAVRVQWLIKKQMMMR